MEKLSLIFFFPAIAFLPNPTHQADVCSKRTGNVHLEELNTNDTRLLAQASIGGDVDLVRKLVESNKTDVNVEISVQCSGLLLYNATPIILSVACNPNLEITKLLIEHGANVNASTAATKTAPVALTALMAVPFAASKAGKSIRLVYQIAQLLIEYCADVNYKFNSSSEGWQSALTVGASLGLKEYVQLLLGSGYSVDDGTLWQAMKEALNNKSPAGKEIVELLSRISEDRSHSFAINNGKVTELEADCNGQEPCPKKILQVTCNTFFEFQGGSNNLTWSAAENRWVIDGWCRPADVTVEELIQEILASNTTISSRIKHSPESGFKAARTVIRELNACGRTFFNVTSLIVASACNATTELIEILVTDLKSDVEAVESVSGWNMVTHAAVHNRLDVVDLAFQVGTNQDTPAANLALYVSLKRNHWEVAEFLIHQGVSTKFVTEPGTGRNLVLAEALKCLRNSRRASCLMLAQQILSIEKAVDCNQLSVAHKRILLDSVIHSNSMGTLETECGFTPRQVDTGCAEKATITDGVVTHGDSHYLSQRNFQCSPGFELVGQPYIECSWEYARWLYFGRCERGRQTPVYNQPGWCQYDWNNYESAGRLQLEFAEALWEGNLTKIKDFVNNGADVNGRGWPNIPSLQHPICANDFLDSFSEPTALMIAIACLKNIDVVQFLVDRGAKVNAVDRGGNTPLGVAISLHPKDPGFAIEVVRFLLDRCAIVSRQGQPGEQVTPLIQATIFGSHELIELLLDAGADPNAEQLITGYTPLLYAIMSGNSPEVVRLFLDRGVLANRQHVQARGHPRVSFSGFSYLSASIRDLKLAQLLLERGADVEMVGPGDATPLLVATSGGNLEAMQLFIEFGADVNANSAMIGTPLIVACRDLSDPEVVEKAVELLLLNGAEPEIVANGRSALDWAIEKRLMKITETFLEVSRETTDKFQLLEDLIGEQPFDEAMAALLLKHGANVTGDGRLLVQAIKNKVSVEFIKLLLENGADINGSSSSVLALAANDLSLFTLLLEHGADVDAAISDNQHFPLMAELIKYCNSFSPNHRRSLISLLLQHGAAILPGDLAYAKSQPQIADLFKDF